MIGPLLAEDKRIRKEGRDTVPCPFCRCKITHLIYNPIIGYCLECEFCQAKGPQTTNKLKAIELWNMSAEMG